LAMHFLKSSSLTPDPPCITMGMCARPTFLAKILNIFGKIFWENGSLK